MYAFMIILLLVGLEQDEVLIESGPFTVLGDVVTYTGALPSRIAIFGSRPNR